MAVLAVVVPSEGEQIKVLIIDSDGGNGQLSTVMRAMDHGHVVKWFYRKPDHKVQPIGKGIAEVVDDWRKWWRWADLVIMGDNTRYLDLVDVWRGELGAPKVIGATKAAAAWELDRTCGQGIFKKAGIAVPPFREFDNYDDAIAYVEREGRCFVSKPCGDEENKALSYVPNSPADLIYMLRRWKKARTHRDSFILQEMVKGCEFAVGGWFGADGFAGGWCENIEHKKLFAGGLGPNTGEMGTALRMVRSSKLADEVLKPLESAIEKTGFTGYVDVNCIVDENGDPWPLEFTMRFGYPTWPIQQHLLRDGDAIGFLHDLASGVDSKAWNLDETAVGVVMAMGDFPHSHMTKKEVVGVPIYGATPGVLERLSFCEVMRGVAPHDLPAGGTFDKPCYVTAGDYVLVAVGLGADVVTARRRAYGTLERLKLPSSPFWRDDIGQGLRFTLPKLQEHGFAKGWTYAES